MTSILEKLKNAFGKGAQSDAKSFRENQENEEAFDHKDLGILDVPLDRIVGSVGRYQDFDNQFRMKSHVPPDRLLSVKDAMRKGKPLPPVKLYKIKNEYYALDGNHRISAAKDFGRTEICAKIVEFIPSSNTLENIIYREKSEFKETTGLEQEIELTEIGQYHYLAQQINTHKRFFEKETTKDVDIKQAASDWYTSIYAPLVSIIEKGRIINAFPDRTIADLYAYISFHQWEKSRTRKYGIGIDKLIPKNMEDFRKKMSNIKKDEYPEMQMGIIAFVMINVEAKRELRIAEKLFSLGAVKEVHSVHGSIDILVKIELTRDLLASDAEIIGQFVHEQIRQIQGIVSTQTLIPGVSKIKPFTG